MNSRMFMAPAAAFSMACILLAYTRSSIREARQQSRNHAAAAKSPPEKP